MATPPLLKRVAPAFKGLTDLSKGWGGFGGVKRTKATPTATTSLGADWSSDSWKSQGSGLPFGGAASPDTEVSFGGLPDSKGDWVNKAQFGLGAAEIGLGVWNAAEQSKMNDFMRGYYGEQMDLQRTDFENAARGTNEALAAKQQRVLSSQGLTTGTRENVEGVSSYMDTWGARETY